MTDDSPAERVRARLNELRVGPMPIEPGFGTIRDYSPDAIGARDLGEGEVELSDRQGRSWIGSADVALKTMEELEAVGDPQVIWARLTTAG